MIDDKTRARFLSKFTQGSKDECWEWQAGIADTGYGLFRFNGRSTGAHRVSYLIFVGEIPDGLCVLHRCDNRPCVNYHHFFLGTLSDNVKDAASKGRMPRGTQHWNAKLSEQDIEEIFTKKRNGISNTEIARLFGVGQPHISDILNGYRRSHAA